MNTICLIFLLQRSTISSTCQSDPQRLKSLFTMTTEMPKFFEYMKFIGNLKVSKLSNAQEIYNKTSRDGLKRIVERVPLGVATLHIMTKRRILKIYVCHTRQNSCQNCDPPGLQRSRVCLVLKRLG